MTKFVISSEEFVEYSRTRILRKLTSGKEKFLTIDIYQIDENTLKLAHFIQELINKPVQDLRNDLIDISNSLR